MSSGTILCPSGAVETISITSKNYSDLSGSINVKKAGRLVMVNCVNLVLSSSSSSWIEIYTGFPEPATTFYTTIGCASDAVRDLQLRISGNTLSLRYGWSGSTYLDSFCYLTTE